MGALGLLPSSHVSMESRISVAIGNGVWYLDRCCQKARSAWILALSCLRLSHCSTWMLVSLNLRHIGLWLLFLLLIQLSWYLVGAHSWTYLEICIWHPCGSTMNDCPCVIQLILLKTSLVHSSHRCRSCLLLHESQYLLCLGAVAANWTDWSVVSGSACLYGVGLLLYWVIGKPTSKRG